MANINSMNVGGQLSMVEDTAAREMEASAYDPTQTYAKEDIVIYDNKLYEANTDISIAEAFNIAHWTETTLGKIAQKHRDSISQLTDKRKLICEEFSSGNITITPNMTYKLPYTVPEGYEYLGFLGAESYNVPTSISYQGNTGNAIALYVNCFGNGGNGAINMRLLFQQS